MSDLIISLTTIPPRMNLIGPTLQDLLNQNADVKEIRLYIPRKYRRFKFSPDDIPQMPKGITVCLVDEDLGPGTKVLHAVRDFRGQDIEILFCDDDQPYDPGWARRFLEARKKQPNCCIVEKGYDLDTRPNGSKYHIKKALVPRAKRRIKGLDYRLFRLRTLFTQKRTPFVEDGYVDVLEGYRGAMIRPEFIPKETFTIPDILWTVDDPWLSGHMTRIGVPIWLFADTPLWKSPYKAHFRERLGAFVYKDHGRLAADTACFEYFRDTYGIWQDCDDNLHAKTAKDLLHLSN